MMMIYNERGVMRKSGRNVMMRKRNCRVMTPYMMMQKMRALFLEKVLLSAYPYWVHPKMLGTRLITPNIV